MSLVEFFDLLHSMKAQCIFDKNKTESKDFTNPFDTNPKKLQNISNIPLLLKFKLFYCHLLVPANIFA